MSIIGGLGDLDGLECRDIADGDREEGNEERDVRRLGAAALPLELPVVSVVPVVPLVVGRCCIITAALGAATFAFAFACFGLSAKG